METVAVYKESRIKTYGFQEITGLALLRFSCPVQKLFSLGQILSGEHLKHLRSKMVMAQVSGQTIHFNLCMVATEGEGFRSMLEKSSVAINIEYISPVGVIYFHGPHFGDRYGIAEAAFSTLSKAGIQVMASDCSAASVYLAMAQENIGRAKDILARTFEVAT